MFKLIGLIALAVAAPFIIKGLLLTAFVVCGFAQKFYEALGMSPSESGIAVGISFVVILCGVGTWRNYFD